MKQNLKKLLGLYSLPTFLTLAHAVPCVFTVIKSDCWGDYKVQVTLSDRNANVPLHTFDLQKNDYFQRIQMDCRPSQVIAAQAQFSPPIFNGDTGKMYNANVFWMIPVVTTEPGAGWSYNICFSKDFANVPFPLGVTGNCDCDFSRVPTFILKENLAK
jgi:hypothetical protein